MGVPKFFRYMSERYPCLSEFVKEYQIPEFDNLYLDMNGIIHNCSHPDDGNPHFRITEEKIYSDIFHYIEILFQMIKPQKVFFMAIDGVAPRAKMNQQRGRRFRSAKDAQKLEDEAVKRGEELPEESRFDSNCITPGTEFMARLHEQLKYFVVKKVSQDPLWQRCQIILSGHETPGEGEHKIMDFIRYKRSQPGYDPNTRHCLYGLDADLIMLGLCTHDPHFSLLREEVKFGKKSTKRSCVPEEIRFFLLHLSLMREYLEMEFGELKQSLKNFKFDIENIIDDWVLMGFLVGNDFIPNLPNLHIANGALPVLYKAYIEILPQLDGYINEGGILNLKRFEVFMKKLGEIDIQNFEEEKEDLLYMEAKTGRKMTPFAKNNTKLRDLQAWKPEGDEENLRPEFLESIEKKNEPKDSGLSALIAATEREYLDDEEDEPTSDSNENDDEEFESYKRSYYINKLEYEKVTPDVMRSQAEGYVRAIQWNLHYYYNGVCSWSWYYPHHYSPYISDIKNFQNLKLEYDIGKPFMPYEQLLAVLPAASKELLPKCYQELMTDENSPIKRYYPENFDTDLNGKRQDWEAVVLVPFIDEEILLEAMKLCNDQLTPSERQRNRHGSMLSYTYTEDNLGVYDSPMYFPGVPNNHAKLQKISIEEIRVPLEKLVKGAYPGVLMDVFYPGFPTLKHLTYQGQLKKAKVKVFEQASRGENMIIQVIPSERVLDAKIPVELLGKTVFVGWPHLVEAKVVAVLNSKAKYVYAGEGVTPIVEESPATFQQEVYAVLEHYNKRLGIEFGKVLVLIKVQTLMGQKYMFTSNGRISLEKTFCENTSNYPLQLIVEDINVYNPSREVYATLKAAFPAGSYCFSLTHNEFYGTKGIIEDDNKTPEGHICVCVTSFEEPDLTKARNFSEDTQCRYRTLYFSASQLALTNYVFSRITGSFFVTARNREGGLKTVNLGLDLKFNKKSLETPGYTKKIDDIWYYTDAAIDVVGAYAEKFPEIFEYIAKNNHNKDETSIDEIFPKDSDEKVKAVQTWLKSQPHSQVERRMCNSKVLEKEVVEEIEKIIDNFSLSNAKNVTLYCKPDLLFKPELCFGNLIPDPSVEVHLFDRIINVRANHTVPFGLKGTIIGIHEVASDLMYDVVFDTKFDAGIEINCSSGKGYRLPLNAFIDISHGARLYQPKSGRSGEKGAVPSQMRREEYNRKYQNHNYQSNRNSNNVASSNSAFAKFNNSQFPSASQSYHAVPPFMPNGDPIYKSHNPYSNRQNYNQHPQKSQNNFNKSLSEQPFDIRNPFPKQYAPNSYPGPRANNSNKTINQTGQAVQVEHKSHNRDNRNKSKNDTNNVNSSQKRADFMPNFKKTAEHNPVEETADALKRLLKIGCSAPSKELIVQHIQQNNESKVQNDFKSQKKGQSSDAVLKDCASVQLLTYYQSRSLGLPRYQYVKSDLGIQSQIKLPNRQIIIGQPAKTREEASEFVAELALKTLNLKEGDSRDNQSKQMKEGPKQFPTPPRQWWSHEQKSEKQSHNERNMNKEIRKRDPPNNDWRGLIPLQVVKKEKANSSSCINTNLECVNEGNNKNKRAVLSEKPGNSSNESTQTSQKKETKPRKERKMRIAANFGAKP